MTPEEAQAKRNELNALARKAEKAGDEALASLCRIVASNYSILADGDQAAIDRLTVVRPPCTESALDKNLRRLGDALAARESAQG